jgi:cell division septation protein DedD
VTLAMRTATPDAAKSKKWRSPRPRTQRVSLSLERRTIKIAIALGVAALGVSFALGFALGRREATAVEPAIEPTMEPASAAIEAPIVAPAAAPDPVPPATPKAEVAPPPETKPAPPPAKAPPAPELDIRIGRVTRPGYGIQIGAFPDVDTAREYLNARAPVLKGYKIYLIPTAIEGRGVWHRARLGLYESKKEAEAAKRKLPEAIAKDAIVVSYR